MDTDDDLDVGIKTPRSRRKQVKPDISHVPTGITTEFRLSSTLDALAKELQDQIEAVKASQEAMLRELTTVVTPMTARRDSINGKRCFICDLPDAHVIGPQNCSEVPILINEGLASFNQVGRLMCPDRSGLPHGVYAGGGLAKALRDEHATALPTATSNSSSSQYNDKDPIDNRNTCYVAYSSPASSSTTCSQLMDTHGFMKGKQAEICANADYKSPSSIRPISAIQRPQVSQTSPPLAPHQAVPSLSCYAMSTLSP
jgi:hypothetical protein